MWILALAKEQIAIMALNCLRTYLHTMRCFTVKVGSPTYVQIEEGNMSILSDHSFTVVGVCSV